MVEAAVAAGIAVALVGLLAIIIGIIVLWGLAGFRIPGPPVPPPPTPTPVPPPHAHIGSFLSCNPAVSPFAPFTGTTSNMTITAANSSVYVFISILVNGPPVTIQFIDDNFGNFYTQAVAPVQLGLFPLLSLEAWYCDNITPLVNVNTQITMHFQQQVQSEAVSIQMIEVVNAITSGSFDNAQTMTNPAVTGGVPYVVTVPGVIASTADNLMLMGLTVFESNGNTSTFSGSGSPPTTLIETFYNPSNAANAAADLYLADEPAGVYNLSATGVFLQPFASGMWIAIGLSIKGV